MNVIYLDVRAIHINPSATLFPSLVAAAFPTAIDASLRPERNGGSHSTLQLMMKRVAGSSEDWVVILGAGIPMLSSARVDARGAAHHLKSSCVTRSTFAEIAGYLSSVNDVLKARHGRGLLLASGLNFDYYAATDSQVSAVQEEGLVLLSPGAEFVRALKDLPETALGERHFLRKQERLSDTWRDWLLRTPERNISTLHFIGESEYPSVSWSQRTQDIEIPGVNYVTRSAARQCLRQSGQSVSRNYAGYAVRAAGRLGLHPFRSASVMQWYQAVYRNRLGRAKLAYVGPGSFGIPVRKYFEAPASGALMICTPCEGLGDLGFVHEVNCLVGDPDDVPRLVNEWVRAPDAMVIANQGRKMVLNQHGTRARAGQIRQAVGAIMDGSYAGSRWIHGEFVIDRR